MGTPKESPEEVLLAWTGVLPHPDEVEDAILAAPETRLAALFVARWLRFNRQMRLRPQTDPEVVKALRKVARRAGNMLGEKVSTMSKETAFFMLLETEDPLADEMSQVRMQRTHAVRADRRTLRLVKSVED